MQTTIKQHYIPRFYMKNFYIKDTKKFDVLDKFNNYTPISQNKTVAVERILKEHLEKEGYQIEKKTE